MPTAIATGNIAHTHVIFQTDLGAIIMNNESLYQITMYMVKKMFSDNLISKEEYAEIDTKMREKYCPIFGTLFTDIDLINL